MMCREREGVSLGILCIKLAAYWSPWSHRASLYSTTDNLDRFDVSVARPRVALAFTSFILDTQEIRRKYADMAYPTERTYYHTSKLPIKLV